MSLEIDFGSCQIYNQQQSFNHDTGGINMKLVASVVKLGTYICFAKTLISYLDPGSGSLIVQLIVAAIAGILATFRFWKTRLLSLFGIREESNEDEESDDSVNQV